MRRACRRSARILARVVLPTRSGPSMTMNRGDCGPRSGTGARLAAVDSLAAIVSWDLGENLKQTSQRQLDRPRRSRVNGRDYSRVVRDGNGEARAVARC